MRRFLVILLAGLALAGAMLWTLRAPDQSMLEARYFTENDRYVEAAGIRWRVRETGPAGVPALVLMHGFSHSLEAFEPWAERLEDEYRVIRFDLPGHGLTGQPPQQAYSNAATLDQVGALLDEIAPENFALGGNSLGGLLAWRYAARNPGRVGALILVSPGGYPINGVNDVPVDVPANIAIYLRSAAEPMVRAAFTALYAEPSKLTETEVERVAAFMKAHGQAMVSRLEQFTLPDPEPVLAQVEAPTLILWGEADIMVPAEHGSRFVEAMPEARLITYEDAGHLAMQELPARTAADVEAFLEAKWR